jgi:hypothetical protein
MQDRHKFPKTSCPSPPGDAIYKIVENVRIHDIIINRKPLIRHRIVTEEKHDNIGHQLYNSPRKICGACSVSEAVRGQPLGRCIFVRITITVVPEDEAMDYGKE